MVLMMRIDKLLCTSVKLGPLVDAFGKLKTRILAKIFSVMMNMMIMMMVMMMMIKMLMMMMAMMMMLMMMMLGKLKNMILILKKYSQPEITRANLKLESTKIWTAQQNHLIFEEITIHCN